MGETPALDDALAALLEERGLESARIETVTTLGHAGDKRQSVHVITPSGEWKGRCVTPAIAERFTALRPYLDDARFPRLVARRGRALLLEWRPGKPIGSDPMTADTARSAGATLAALHAHTAAEEETLERFAFPARKWPLRAGRAFDAVAETDLLTHAERVRIQRLLKSSPTIDRTTLVHGDFCPENFVIDDDGTLHVIDNETLSVDDRLWDLARTWIRWPMSRTVADAFWEGYGGPPTDVAESLVWWSAAACLEASAFRLRAKADVTPALDMLRRILADGPDAFSPFASTR